MTKEEKQERANILKKMRAMKDAGYTVVEIANCLGFSESQVRRLLENKK